MKPKAICILGTHRSGTSTVTRAVNLYFGAYLGESDDLLSPAIDNPEGFWERRDVVDFNERLLNKFNLRWDAVCPLPYKWDLLEEVKPFRDELTDLILKKFSGHHLWAWKDPRTSIVLPLWKRVLNDLDVGLLCVFVVRNPLDVAVSLEKRNGFPHQKTYCLWLNFILSSLNSVADTTTVYISYDKLLSSWESELSRCAEQFKMPSDISKYRDEINKFLKASLRHSYSGIDDLKMYGTPYPVIELYETLLEVANGADISEVRFQSIINRISKDFHIYSDLFRDNISQLFRYEQMLFEKDTQLVEKNRLIYAKDWQIADKERQLKAILNTRSWKITAPLRSLGSFLKLDGLDNKSGM